MRAMLIKTAKATLAFTMKHILMKTIMTNKKNIILFLFNSKDVTNGKVFYFVYVRNEFYYKQTI